ncbi:MAG: integrin alpha, partial [Phycisphaerales bacterium]
MHHRTYTTASVRVAGALVVACGLAGAADAQFVEPDAAALQTFTGQSGESYGWAVADLADIDGDGVTDAISGAPFNAANGPRSGRVEVRSGATGALLFAFVGDSTEDFYGYAVADAGDVDGDGVNDIATGGPRADGFLGQVVVWSGATGQQILKVQSPAGSLFLGAAVSSAGDVNGDGRADVLGGAPFNGQGFLQGAAYVFSGADGSILRTYTSPANAGFGWGAALTGDVDGDGVGEHIIGAPGMGYAEVYSGATGDLLYRFDGDPTWGAYGQFFVAGAGDVDGDCVPDFYVGDFADRTDPNVPGPANGAAYVYSGADGSRIMRLTGQPGDGMGCGRGAGDVTGVGYDDLA